MKATLIAAAVVIAGAFSANAQPLPPKSIAPATAQSGQVQQVDYACGPGWRLNRWGDCVPRRGPPPREYRHHSRDWGWGPPPRRGDWGPPPRHRDWGPPPRRGDWGPPPRW